MTTTYLFKAGYTKNGIAAAPSSAPTITITDGTSTLVTAAATTSTTLTGEYRYSYSGAAGLDLTGFFHTTDATVDQQDLYSTPVVYLSINTPIIYAVNASAGMVYSYATLQEFKNYFTSRGGQQIPADSTDDTVLEQLLLSASRYLDDKTGRYFYPLIETRLLNTPDDECLHLDGDLLEILTLTNGNSDVISSGSYSLLNHNSTPYWAVKLKASSGLAWFPDTYGDTEGAISLAGVWGYHERYSAAWLATGTTAEALDASETGVDVTDGTAFSVGQIARIDNELMYVSGIATNTLTVTRGANGSTAATHLTSATVKTWQVMELAKQAVLEIANQAKARRFGQSLTNTETITPGGIVLSPRDIPSLAVDFIKTFRRRV